MKKKIITIHENTLRKIISESIRNVALNEEKEWNGLLSCEMSADEVITEVIRTINEYSEKATNPETKQVLDELSRKFVDMWAVY